MVLGSSLEGFEASRLPGTLSNFTYILETFEASFGLLNGTTMETVEIRQLMIARLDGILASVPSIVFDLIRCTIEQDASLHRIVSFVDPGIMYSNCSRDIVAQIPSITISLRTQGGFARCLSRIPVFRSKSSRRLFSVLMKFEFA